MKNKKVEDALLDIAAELVVSPIALYAKGHQIAKDIKESETGKTVNTTVKQAGADISAAAKTFAESETGQLVKDTVNDTTEKVKETAEKVKETAVKVKESVVEVADDAINKTKETVETVKDFINDIKTEAETVETETVEGVVDPQAAEPAAEEAPAPAKRGRPKKTVE